ncbi:hypothetical protein Tco_1264330 [Tanacetum coccineum]
MAANIDFASGYLLNAVTDMAPLPLGDQRHLWLCYQVEGYTEEILGGARHSMTWRQLILALGLHTTKDMSEDEFGAYWYLKRHALRERKSSARLSGGHFIGRLAHHFGLVSDDGLRGLSVVTREIPLVDMGELAECHLWRWRRLYRMRILLAVPAPDVRSLRGLVERSMTDQDRFSTWMISCMTQLMETSELTYQAFDGFSWELPQSFERTH